MRLGDGASPAKYLMHFTADLRRWILLCEMDNHGMPTAKQDPQRPVYLRIGAWNPRDPRSHNYARGDIEAGLSVYDLDAAGQPVVPEEGEWAEVDMRDRLASTEPKFLVQGDYCGEGHDGEPLLAHPVVVGHYAA